MRGGIPDLDDQLIHLVRRAHQEFYRALQQRLASEGIMMGHWIFLRLLWVHPRLTQKELSDRASLRAPPTFIALKGMEKLGLIRRESNTVNRRDIRISLTGRGRALRRPLMSLASRIDERALTGLSTGTIATVRRALETIIANLEHGETRRKVRAKGGPGAKSKRRSTAIKPGTSPKALRGRTRSAA